MFFKKPLLGLDLGSSSVKVADLKISGRKAVLNDLSMVPVAKGAVEAGDIISPEVVAGSLKSIVDRKGYKNYPAAVGMFGGAVLVKKITMPRMDPKIVNEQLRWEAEQYIPFNIDESVFDFHIINTASTETMDVLLVAARQEHIFRYFESVESAGLKCSIVDVNGLALANCFEFNYGIIPGTIALVNIGASVTNLVIIDSGSVVFSRDIPYGGHLYDTEISRDLGVGLQEAESLKIGLSYQQETPQEVLTAIGNINETLGMEINNSFDFYRSSGATQPVSQIFTSGGVIRTPGLTQKIQDTTRISCTTMDPFIKVEVNSKKISADLKEQIRLFSPVAIGLALRGSTK
jgi:type IV pilus assembly protein PilM